jgi:hypothetical protein
LRQLCTADHKVGSVETHIERMQAMITKLGTVTVETKAKELNALDGQPGINPRTNQPFKVTPV